MKNSDRYTVLGVEKPFPWVGLLLFAGAVAAGGPLLIMAGVWAVTRFDEQLYTF